MHAISSYRGNRPTNKQNHTHTYTNKPTDRTDYNTSDAGFYRLSWSMDCWCSVVVRVVRIVCLCVCVCVGFRMITGLRLLLQCVLAAVQCIVIGPVCGCVCGCGCLCVCASVTTITQNCVHRFSPTGFVDKGSDCLQLIKFWPSRTPGKGIQRRGENFWLCLTTASM